MLAYESNFLVEVVNGRRYIGIIKIKVNSEILSVYFHIRFVRGFPHPMSRKLVFRRVHYELYCRIETVLHIAETFQLPSLRPRKREILQHTTLAER
jgi:hypothetical protein